MRVLLFGTYDTSLHPRVATMAEGLRATGAEVAECNAPLGLDTAARVAALKQSIAFAQAGGSESDLSARVTAAPADHEARLALAGAYASRKAWREAMDQLLEIIRRDKAWRNGEARKQMIAIFNLAADQPDLVSEYRRKMASALNP